MASNLSICLRVKKGTGGVKFFFNLQFMQNDAYDGSNQPHGVTVLIKIFKLSSTGSSENVPRYEVLVDLIETEIIPGVLNFNCNNFYEFFYRRSLDYEMVNKQDSRSIGNQFAN